MPVGEKVKVPIWKPVRELVDPGAACRPSWKPHWSRMSGKPIRKTKMLMVMLTTSAT